MSEQLVALYRRLAELYRGGAEWTRPDVGVILIQLGLHTIEEKAAAWLSVSEDDRRTILAEWEREPLQVWIDGKPVGV